MTIIASNNACKTSCQGVTTPASLVFFLRLFTSMMEAQLQTKLEAEERLAAIKDLQAWTSKQKDKDEYLSKSNFQLRPSRSPASTVSDTPSRSGGQD